ncbi:MAG: 30S ribosomal protein S7 [Spirochaetaceae bacterium]|nr:30S ribosomal protein S7 [Spirochaetaceae bacterium]
MSRKKITNKREVPADPKYNSVLVTKFICRMMLDGKKTTTTRLLYSALDTIQKKTGEEPLGIFTKAIENIRPIVEVKSRRVGGATYQVPTDVPEARSEALAMRWIINAARKRSGKGMEERLAAEVLDAYNNTGTAFKKREEVHRMAEANKAFSHFRF